MVQPSPSLRGGIDWERRHTLSSLPALADDAEWMSGKSRNRLAPALAEASSPPADGIGETGIEPNTVRQSERRVLGFFKEEMGETIARISRSRQAAIEAQERDQDRDRGEDGTRRIVP